MYELTWNYTNYVKNLIIRIEDENNNVISEKPYFYPGDDFDPESGDYIIDRNNYIVAKSWHLAAYGVTANGNVPINLNDLTIVIDKSFSNMARYTMLAKYTDIQTKITYSTNFIYTVDFYDIVKSYLAIPFAGEKFRDISEYDLASVAPSLYCHVLSRYTNDYERDLHAYITNPTSTTNTCANNHWRLLKLIIPSYKRATCQMVSPTYLFDDNGNRITLATLSTSDTIFTAAGTYALKPRFTSPNTYLNDHDYYFNAVIFAQGANDPVTITGLTGKVGFTQYNSGDAWQAIFTGLSNSNGKFIPTPSGLASKLVPDMMTEVKFTCRKSTPTSNAATTNITYNRYLGNEYVETIPTWDANNDINITTAGCVARYGPRKLINFKIGANEEITKTGITLIYDSYLSQYLLDAQDDTQFDDVDGTNSDVLVIHSIEITPCNQW